MYTIKVESDPTCIMSEPFYGVTTEPYLLYVYREDNTPLIEIETANLAEKYEKFASRRILPKFTYIKENVEIEEVMQAVEEFRSLKRKRRCKISFYKHIR